MSEALPIRYQLLMSMRGIITADRSGFGLSGRRDIERLIWRVPDRHLGATRRRPRWFLRCVSWDARA